MTDRCLECGGITAWDDDAASAICTSCGNLTDPSQSILSTHADQGRPYNPSVPSTGLWDPAIPTTLKSLRTGSNWNLAGQATKEARDRKNSFAIAEFINSLAHSLNATGLSPRATNIHIQAMKTGRFRWGRKAKLVAGACLAIALREYKRPDSLHDIAFLLDEPFPVLVRTLANVISTLKLPCVLSDASVHIPSLQAYLGSILVSTTHDLPLALIAQLKCIPLRAAANTSTALCILLARLVLDHRVNSLSGPPTGCALFMLGLESEARAPLPNLGDLAACLAIHCHTSRSVVMERYKIIQDEVSIMINKVPWLSKYEPKKGRAKVSKRAVVARGLADVVQFQNELWSKIVKPTVVLDISDEEDEYIEEGKLDDNNTSSPLPFPLPPSDFPAEQATRKRRKTKHNPLHDAAAFLVNPLSAPLPPSALSRTLAKPHTPPPNGSSPTDAPSLDDVIASNSTTPVAIPYLPFTSYILNLPSGTTLSSSRPPTRLQLLLASRGKEEEIRDEELFGDGELEGLFRPEEQVEELRAYFGWREEETSDAEEETGNSVERTKGIKNKVRFAKKKKEKRQGGDCDLEGQPVNVGAQAKKSRINLQALAKFLEEPADEKDDAEYTQNEAFFGLEAFEHEEMCGSEEGFDNIDLTSHFDPPRTPPQRKKPFNATNEELIIDEWHPLSPEAGRGHRPNVGTDFEEYCDEEYD